jgi:hypothetical protein
MNIFSFLKEEQDLVQNELTELVDKFRHRTREANFDAIKLICDKLRGYCKKQLELLLAKIDAESGFKAELEEANNQRERLLSDINDLVMVHVDEPGYEEYLVNLLNHTKDFFAASNKLYAKLPAAISQPALGKIDADLQEAMHAGVGFNNLPAS